VTPIARSLRRPVIDQLGTLLDRHHRRLQRLNDETDRFRLLLDDFFSGFPSQNQDRVPGTRKLAQCLDREDNLDTGNASMPPFPPFVSALRRAASDPLQYRSYHGPRPIPLLEDRVMAFLVRQGLLREEESSDLGVVVGSGTVHLYDLACRQLLRRPGDVLLTPAITYGWFMPQVQRARGRAHLIELDGEGRVSPDVVASTIDRLNTDSMRRWLLSLPARLAAYGDDLATVCPGGVRAPAGAEVRPLRRVLGELPPPWVADELVAAFLRDRVALTERARRLVGMATGYPVMPAPPRVVAFLHINPTLLGVTYGREHVRRLAAVLRERRVTVIEDLAYHSIGVPLSALGTFLGEACDRCCLLGLSKAFSLPNCRIGVLITDRSRADSLVGAVENSVGHVSTMVQQALLEALDADPAGISEFLDASRYAPNRALMTACLEGIGSPRLSEEERCACAATIEAEVTGLLQWKRSHGVELEVRDLVHGVEMPEHEHEGDTGRLAARAFMSRGLREWFRVLHHPEAGFFIVVDCGPLLARGSVAGVPLRSAFDVFALLSFLFGVRVVPDDLLGGSPDAGGLLRLSFSCRPVTIVRALFTTYVGLHQLLCGEGSG
jgi:aspartate/methionine/tyrosine aminotransferase